MNKISQSEFVLNSIPIVDAKLLKKVNCYKPNNYFNNEGRISMMNNKKNINKLK